MKKVLISFALLAAAGAVFLYFYLNKSHRQVADEEIAYKLNAGEFFAAFEEDEKKANETYLNKVIQVAGPVDEVLKDRQGDYVLILQQNDEGFGVKCAIAPEDSAAVAKVKVGDSVTVNCICTGGDGLFDVEMVKCRFADKNR